MSWYQVPLVAWRIRAFLCLFAIALLLTVPHHAYSVNSWVDVGHGSPPATSVDVAADAALSAYELGYEHYRAGHLLEAEQHFLASLRTDPNLLKAHYWLGKVLSERGLLEEANHHWEEVLRLERLLNERRTALQLKDNEYPALAQIKRAQARLEQAASVFNKGNNLLQEGHWTGAIAEFKDAVRLYPGAKNYVLALARALRDSGNNGAAAGSYAHVLSLPNLSGNEILEAVEFAARHDDPRMPIQYLHVWLAKHPNDTQARQLLGKIDQIPPPPTPVAAARIIQRLRGQVIVNIGLDNGLKLADEFTLNLRAVRAGDKIVDPETGASLGRMPDTTTGELLLTKVNAQTSWALIKREYGSGVKEGDLIESSGWPSQRAR